MTGHIAHINLNDEMLPYKYLIGQVILEKNSKLIRTVVNKVGKIANEFRVFDMEIIAGVEEFDTEVKENSCRFRFNFREVYWNSRLSTEHARIVDLMATDDFICDMFAGVGPFAVPAAKKCTVYANDLNPRSFHSLKENASLNKVSSRLHAYNMDARAFFKNVRAKQRLGEIKPFQHVVMNLPAIAIEFLDVFRGAYTVDEASSCLLPLVHCYCFSGKEGFQQDVLQRAEAVLGCSLESPIVRFVRNVAPNKNMFCLTFRVPTSLCGSNTPESSLNLKRTLSDSESCSEPDIKKAKR
eukprot:978798_1